MNKSNEHIVYADEFNKAGNRTKAGKNKKLAQEVGISYAQKMFDFMKDVKNQGTNFRWETFGHSLTGVACSSLFSYFASTPKNLTELEEITKYAVITEWQILLDNAKENNIELPKAGSKESAKQTM